MEGRRSVDNYDPISIDIKFNRYEEQCPQVETEDEKSVLSKFSLNSANDKKPSLYSVEEPRVSSPKKLSPVPKPVSI